MSERGKRAYQRKKASMLAAREAWRNETFPCGCPPTTRTQNVLKNMTSPQPVTPELVASFSSDELLSQPNFGRKCLPEVVAWLATFGLKLRLSEIDDEKARLLELRELAELSRLKAKYE